MDILTVSVQKGGSGKTTTAAAIAQAAAYDGKRILAVDCDPQGNLSFCLAAQIRQAGNSYDLLMGKPAADLIQTTRQGLDVIPASKGLATITSNRGSARRLQKALEPVKGHYDMIVIDTPSPPGELLYNALQASTGIVIPLETGIYNLQSLYQTVDTAQQIKKSNPGLTFTGIIITKYEGRANVLKSMEKNIREKAAELSIPYLGVVRKAAVIEEAASFQESLFEYAPRSKPAAAYWNIYKSITHQRQEEK